MIVVAIIGILAAIAIPQFAAYRIRGFNSAAQSDVKNVGTSEAAMFSDWQRYGTTQATNAGPFAVVAPAAGVAVLGGDLNGDGIATTDFAGTARGITISISNGVTLFALTDVVPAAGAAGTAGAFVVAGKHLQGNTTFGIDGDSANVYQNTALVVGAAGSQGVGTALTTALYSASVAANTANVDDIGAVGGNWVVK